MKRFYRFKDDFNDSWRKNRIFDNELNFWTNSVSSNAWLCVDEGLYRKIIFCLPIMVMVLTETTLQRKQYLTQPALLLKRYIFY